MKKWILLVIGLQFVALLFIAAKREWIHSYGETVYLRTAPVDPRDLFRGDYVQLQYDIAFPGESTLATGLKQKLEIENMRYRQVYVQLNKNSYGVAEISTVNLDKPASGIFIKGQIGQHLRRIWRFNGRIKYGIEKYFVEQGSGLDIEKKLGRGQDWQTAMEVEVALGGDGTAVIRGHRWSDLGVKLEVLETATVPTATDSDETPARRNPKVAMHLRNQSDHVISIIDTDSHCGYQLVQDQNTDTSLGAVVVTLKFPQRDCAREAATVHALAPEEIYSISIDFEDPRWFIVQADTTVAIADIAAAWSGFRLVYQPPSSFRPEPGSNERIWTTRIGSTRFNATGRVD